MPQRHTTRNPLEGFTLIELSIVLVVIGLIIGGILVGRDLINAAEIRATISQVEKYRAAVNTFQSKFNCIPGDCLNAAAFGFIPRGNLPGEGDGDGLLQGINGLGGFSDNYQGAGETVVFWVDLSTANLIDGSFTTASETVAPGANITGGAIGNYYPKAKLGRGNYFYVYSKLGTAYNDGVGSGSMLAMVGIID